MDTVDQQHQRSHLLVLQPMVISPFGGVKNQIHLGFSSFNEMKQLVVARFVFSHPGFSRSGAFAVHLKWLPAAIDRSPKQSGLRPRTQAHCVEALYEGKR